MKKLMQRFFGIAVSAAMLFTSGMTAVADVHSHHIDERKLAYDSATDGTSYTITLTVPDGYVVDRKNEAFGAYQIFTGTVDDDKGPKDPGTELEDIPLTDIKWGNAFGTVGTDDWQKNIVDFVLALANPQITGADSSAFLNFTGFETLLDEDTKTELNDRFYSDPSAKTNATVKFDKLATEVAEVIAQDAHQNREWLQAFTDILGGYGENYSSTGTHTGYVTQCYDEKGKWDDVEDEYTMTVPAGYYMILDLSTIDDADTERSYSARMLFVANNVTQVLKADHPTLDKKIVRDDNKEYKTDVAGVGDTVHFQLKGTLPSNYENYTEGYKYIFDDKLSKGLDLVKSDGSAYVDPATGYFTVKVKGLYTWDSSNEKWNWNATATATIPVEVNETIAKTGVGSVSDEHLSAGKVNYTAQYAEQELTITFPCLREIRVYGDDDLSTTVCRLGYEAKSKVSSEIFIDYYAKVNENAIVSPKVDENYNGNYNQAQIEYSDNPQAYGDTDKTTIHSATVYTFGLDITKIDAAAFLKNDGDETKAALEGAGFILVREKDKATHEYEIAKFIEVPALVSPSTDAPFGGEKYYSIESWKELGTLDVNGEKTSGDETDDTLEGLFKKLADTADMELTTGADGHLNISGLDEKITYTMVETTAPKDYAKIDPFTITLTANKGSDEEYDGTLQKAEVSNEVESGKSFTFEKFVQLNNTSYADGSANMLVANFKYTDLPSTGGVGTVWFYILGAGGVGLAGVLFFLSKKKVTK